MSGRVILHCDCNCFYASVEQAYHPELAAELEARVRAHLMEVQNSRIKQPAAPAKPVDVSADDFDAE